MRDAATALLDEMPGRQEPDIFVFRADVICLETRHAAIDQHVAEIGQQVDAVAQSNPDIAPVMQQVKALLRQAIVAKAQASGTAVLVVSDELDELHSCQRVLVIFKGRIVREFGAGWSERDLIAAIEGVDA